MLDLPDPYLLFLGAARDPLAAKMALACAFWRPDRCIGQLRLAGCNADAGLPDLTVERAQGLGARAFVVGVVNPGGYLAPEWTAVITDALAHGLDVISGMHEQLVDIPAIAHAARANDRRLIELRHARPPLAIATGRKRSGRRLLTVGTDCSVGKMFTALALERELQRRSRPATFRATGQTGVLIAGAGIAIDAVVADFIAGAAELLSPDAPDDHWDIIEGQGSLLHPAFAGVTLGLVHGSQPDALVLCHEPTRPHMRNLPARPMPSVAESARAHEQAARLTNPDARTIGIAVNTSRLSAEDARACIDQIADESGLPCIDPVRDGAGKLVDLMDAEP